MNNNHNKRVLEIQDLSINFNTYRGVVKAIDCINLAVYENQVLGIIGESGSGKTVTALTILGLLSIPPAQIKSGRVFFGGRDILRLPQSELRRIRGREISMIFQEPASSLNPVAKIGDQIIDVLKLHSDDAKVDRSALRTKATELLEKVRMPRPSAIMRAFPHELSGGMQQRVMIALAISCAPKLLIADEPTSFLDVTVQKRVLDILWTLQKESNLSMIFITHNFGILSDICDVISVMYAGNILEYGSVENLLYRSKHPYTKKLIEAVPDIEKAKVELASIPGTIPSLINPPSGCRFHPRCSERQDICGLEKPVLIQIEENHFMACHRVKNE